MITPQVEDTKDARADFEELDHVGHVVLIGSHGLGGGSCLLRAEDGERVLVMTLNGQLPPEAAKSVVRQLETPSTQWDGMSGTHLILCADGMQPGFLEALDAEAIDWKITYRPPEKLDVEVEAAIEAIPLGEQLPAVPVTLSFSEADFSRQVSSQGPVDGEFLGRLMALGEEEVLRSDWKYLYFFHGSWGSALMALAFLDGHGIPYQTVEDSADGEFGVLTNFVSAQVARAIARRQMRETLEVGKTKSTDEELMELLHKHDHDDTHGSCSDHGE